MAALGPNDRCSGSDPRAWLDTAHTPAAVGIATYASRYEQPLLARKHLRWNRASATRRTQARRAQDPTVRVTPDGGAGEDVPAPDPGLGLGTLSGAKVQDIAVTGAVVVTVQIRHCEPPYARRPSPASVPCSWCVYGRRNASSSIRIDTLCRQREGAIRAYSSPPTFLVTPSSPSTHSMTTSPAPGARC